jgi:hypothetical protein
MKSPLFVTLTIGNTTEARAGIKHLRASFGRWRRGAWFKRLDVKGGVASLEVTNRGNGWHPHLHVLLDCPWLAQSRLMPQPGDSRATIKAKTTQSQAELSHAWAAASRQPSAIVWVKKSGPEIVTEVLKYAVKPADLIDSDDNPGDVIRAIERTRLVTSWGNCYGINKALKAQMQAEREPCRCEECQASDWIPDEVWSRMFGRSDPPPRTYYRQQAEAARLRGLATDQA